MTTPDDHHDSDMHTLHELLDQHAWPAMPDETHARLRASLAPRRRRTRRLRRAAPVAAALLLGVALGLAIPRAPQPARPVERVASEVPPASHVIVSQAVFNAAGAHRARPADPSRWSTVAPR